MFFSVLNKALLGTTPNESWNFLSPLYACMWIKYLGQFEYTFIKVKSSVKMFEWMKDNYKQIYTHCVW